MFKKNTALLIIKLLGLGFIKAQVKNDSTLIGQVNIYGKQKHILHNSITNTEMMHKSLYTITNALAALPGVTLNTNGARNEQMVSVRGFDGRQVPLFLDGIPVYVPYDGYIDLGRLTTFDIEEVKLEKGYTSLVYGINTLGGAINLITKKPLKKFEVNAMAGYITGGHLLNASIGSNLGKFYLHSSVSQLKRNAFPLSARFDAVRTQSTGNRDNAYNNDVQYSCKAGWTPNNKHEFALQYNVNDCKKGTPVYAGNDTLNSLYRSPRYWQWPEWNKQSVYAIYNGKYNAATNLKLRAYYDKFQNALFSYDDKTYTTQLKPYAFQSFYDDYTTGTIGEFSYKVIPMYTVQLAAQVKNDVHREHNLNEPVRNFNDHFFSVGVENHLQPTKAIKVNAGISYNYQNNINAESYNSTTRVVEKIPSEDNYAFNTQLGVFTKLNQQHTISATFALNTRFPTLKDRYSYRLGVAIPNPQLAKEQALHYELGHIYTYKVTNIQTNIFYTRIKNVIQLIDNASYDTTLRKWYAQQQNAGVATFYGAEWSVSTMAYKHIHLGANFSYIKQQNISNPDKKFVNVPQYSVTGFMQYNYKNIANLLCSGVFNTKRYSTSYGTIAKEYFVQNIKVGVNFKSNKYVVEAGINNVLDKNYAIVEGYPEAGRNFMVNFIYKY
jgi:iron complex outermembrane recepter protein